MVSKYCIICHIWVTLKWLCFPSSMFNCSTCICGPLLVTYICASSNKLLIRLDFMQARQTFVSSIRMELFFLTGVRVRVRIRYTLCAPTILDFLQYLLNEGQSHLTLLILPGMLHFCPGRLCAVASWASPGTFSDFLWLFWHKSVLKAPPLLISRVKKLRM